MTDPVDVAATVFPRMEWSPQSRWQPWAVWVRRSGVEPLAALDGWLAGQSPEQVAAAAGRDRLPVEVLATIRRDVAAALDVRRTWSAADQLLWEQTIVYSQLGPASAVTMVRGLLA